MKHKILCTAALVLSLLLSFGTERAGAQDPRKASGHWSGTLNLSGGYGQILLRNEDGEPVDTLRHYLGEAAFRLAYQSPKFSFSTEVKGKGLHKDTETDRFASNGVDKGDFKARLTQLSQPSGGLRTDLQWRPSGRNQYTFFAGYQFENDDSFATIFNGSIHEDLEHSSFSLMGEQRVHRKHTILSGWRSSHGFRDGRRSLHLTLDGTAKLHDKSSLWMDVGPDGLRTYILMPNSDNLDQSAALFLRDNRPFGIRDLQLESGVRLRSTYTEDTNQAYTQYGENDWRDSTRLNERFDYLALWAEPFFKADYRKERFRLQAEGALQWYGMQLTDERHFRDLAWEKPVPVGSLRGEWTPAAPHKLALSTSFQVRQPTYLQRCWYDRQDADAQRLFRGNPDLQPVRIHALDFAYTFRLGRFSTISQSNFTYRKREVEQTYVEEIIDGRKYKVFSWLNTAYGESFTQSLSVGWNGKVLTGLLKTSYRQALQLSGKDDRESRSHHWELSGELACTPGKGWTLATKGYYCGDVQTLYSLLKGYCTLNARIEKAFRPITVFVEGRDLLDQPVTMSYYSSDGTDNWTEESNLNRRLILLGVNWRF